MDTCPHCGYEEQETEEQILEREAKKWAEAVNLNMTIFDVYDEVRDWPDYKLEVYLSVLKNSFNLEEAKRYVDELAYHLSIDINSKKPCSPWIRHAQRTEEMGGGKESR